MRSKIVASARAESVLYWYSQIQDPNGVLACNVFDEALLLDRACVCEILSSSVRPSRSHFVTALFENRVAVAAWLATVLDHECILNNYTMSIAGKKCSFHMWTVLLRVLPIRKEHILNIPIFHLMARGMFHVCLYLVNMLSISGEDLKKQRYPYIVPRGIDPDGMARTINMMRSL